MKSLYYFSQWALTTGNSQTGAGTEGIVTVLYEHCIFCKEQYKKDAGIWYSYILGSKILASPFLSQVTITEYLKNKKTISPMCFSVYCTVLCLP